MFVDHQLHLLDALIQPHEPTVALAAALERCTEIVPEDQPLDARPMCAGQSTRWCDTWMPRASASSTPGSPRAASQE